MTTIQPLAFDWDGESMTPTQPRLADKQYVVGERYRLAPYEDRSQASHNSYFAAIAEAWSNLPEELAERFATPDHLRKYALIKAGYHDQTSVVCGSHAEALRVAAWAKQIDDFAIVVVEGATVTRYTAKSQSYRAQGKKDFQESKDKVLDILAGMIGTKPETLRREAGQAA